MTESSTLLNWCSHIPECMNVHFVMLPLSEIAPQAVHPTLKITVSEIAAELSDQGVVPRWRDRRIGGLTKSLVILLQGLNEDVRSYDDEDRPNEDARANVLEHR